MSAGIIHDQMQQIIKYNILGDCAHEAKDPYWLHYVGKLLIDLIPGDTRKIPSRNKLISVTFFDAFRCWSRRNEPVGFIKYPPKHKSPMAWLEFKYNQWLINRVLNKYVKPFFFINISYDSWLENSESRTKIDQLDDEKATIQIKKSDVQYDITNDQIVVSYLNGTDLDINIHARDLYGQELNWLCGVYW